MTANFCVGCLFQAFSFVKPFAGNNFESRLDKLTHQHSLECTEAIWFLVSAINFLKTHRACLCFMPKCQQKIVFTARHNINYWSKCDKTGQKVVPLCHCLVSVLAEFACLALIFSILFLDTHVHFTMELPINGPGQQS